jgi:hypothetical protein
MGKKNASAIENLKKNLDFGKKVRGCVVSER